MRTFAETEPSKWWEGWLVAAHVGLRSGPSEHFDVDEIERPMRKPYFLAELLQRGAEGETWAVDHLLMRIPTMSPV